MKRAGAVGVLALALMVPGAEPSTVHAETWSEAWSQCSDVYGYGSETFVDCVNAAAEYFYGRGATVYWKA